MSSNEMDTDISQQQRLMEESRDIENEDQNCQQINTSDTHLSGEACSDIKSGVVVVDKNDNLGGANQSKSRKNKRLNRGNVKCNQITKMRAPQQPAMPRKLSHKSFKAHVKSCKQAIKAELENIYNAKNQSAQRKQNSMKNAVHNYSKLIGNRTAQFAMRSKFFLPAKRPRKEIIVPPTKFLLGGNISDPLNLNGLQNESQNPTPNPTPHQSPVTTPPKVEVIIPPNIYDPLHLLDPVDSIEYEKQLVSPMKRKTKPKHRHRKKKPKRKSTIESSSETDLIDQPGGSITGTQKYSTSTGPTCTISCAPASSEIVELVKELGESKDASKSNENRVSIKEQSSEEPVIKSSVVHQEVNEGKLAVIYEEDAKGECSGGSGAKTALDLSNSSAGGRSTEKSKTSHLKLDFSDLSGGDQHSISSCGRKRRISEGPNKCSKFRKMDAIVSPVVPQPGAWKRPPRTQPTGARKGSRLRSTSISENELISPTDETKSFECDSIRDDTPEIDIHKNILECEAEKDIPGTSTDACQQPPRVNQSGKQLPKFRSEGARYQYGNFDRYAGYRKINEMTDVRLAVFHRNANLFRGKDILDVGCNAGHITIAVAKDLAPKSITGLDIDKDLVTRARRNVSMYVRIPKDKPKPDDDKVKVTRQNVEKKDEKIETMENVVIASTSHDSSVAATFASEVSQGSSSPVKSNKESKKRCRNKRKRRHHGGRVEKDKVQFFPISFPLDYGGIKDISKYVNTSPKQLSVENSQFPRNVFFRTANYVLKDETLINNETQQYDVILCLSVTKWIHLNFGDAGLKLAFKRMFNQLRPGGKLILEAQNWASYKKKKNLTETIYTNYRNIEFYPNKFHEYLLGSEVGFSHSYCLGLPRHMNKGFCRPIQLYAKGDYTPNHIRWSDNYHPQTPYEAYRGIYVGMTRPRYPFVGPMDTPRGNSGSYSCRQTPAHTGTATSQYYNPLESDSYLPSYGSQVQNGHYVFASPLYQTIWSPPASLRNGSNKTPLFGSIREVDSEECVSRHVYPPNDFATSPQAGSAFNSVREPDNEDTNQQAPYSRPHVYASCDDHDLPATSYANATDNNDSSSPRNNNDTSVSPNTMRDSSENMDQQQAAYVNDETENDASVNDDVDATSYN